MIELNPPLHSVSERTQERFGIVRDTEATYWPNDDVLRAIGHKSLIPIIGPSAVGKSFIIDTLVGMDPRFDKVLSFSTRNPRREDTPETMACLPWDERHIKRICNTIEAGDAVQYAFHRQTGDIYGTTLESYPGDYNLLPALTTSIANLEQLPFRSLRTIGLVTSPELWSQWFAKREIDLAPEDRPKRIAEAANSLTWLLDHPEVAIINNPAGDAFKTAKKIRSYARKSDTANIPRDEKAAQDLLAHVTSLRHDA
ncbi:MAG: hypothetical protein ABIP74_05040 [Candidatus Saccharimonas sp.]